MEAGEVVSTPAPQKRDVVADSVRVVAPVFFGAGEAHRIVDLDIDAPRAGEVRVRMAASGVCHSCLYAMDGDHASVPTPIVLGDEGAGVVEAVGDAVEVVAPGDHVIVSWAPGCGACRWCHGGLPALCANLGPLGAMADGTTRFHTDGADVAHYGPATNSPLTVVPERAVVPIPAEIPLELAALVGCAVATGVGAVRNTARLRVGESVVVVGCGGVGSSVIHGAALSGASPIVAIDVVQEKFPMLERLGATHCLDATVPEVAEQVLSITGGGAAYSFVATSSPGAFELAFNALSKRGTCVVIAGHPDGVVLSFDPVTLLNGERQIVGSKYGSTNPPVDFPILLDLYRNGMLNLNQMVSGRWPPNEIEDAYAALRSGRALRGLIVFDS